jgi:quercetin dioxygenase-like cupin family protein
MASGQRDQMDLFRAHAADLEWQDDLEVFELGEGVQVKLLYSDAKAELVDLLVKFPAGYVEPRHVHDSTHSVVVLEGIQIAEGEPMRPGDYVFGGANTPHGPFEYPEGCIVFASFRGRSLKHVPQSHDQQR